MTANLKETTKGNYTLRQELWCDGEDVIIRSDGKKLYYLSSLFDELVNLEKKANNKEQMMSTLSEHEKTMVKAFLQNYSDVLGNRACNDWEFPNDWTHKEKVNFVEAYHKWNGDPEEFDENHLSLPDFAIVSFLASKI